VLAVRIFAGLLCSVALVFPASALAQERIVVRSDAGVDAAQHAALRSRVHGRLIGRIGGDTDVIAVPNGTAKGALRKLAANTHVRWAQRDVVVRGAAADPLPQWGLTTLDAPTAWTQSAGTGATVALVDSGTTFGHEDLAGQFATNPREIPGNGRDDDRNGKVDDWRGWDWVGTDDNDPTDGNGHGTHVSGIVAAQRDNGVGIAGVAPGATIMPLRVLDNSKSGYLSDVAAAFRYAGSLGIRVVNASLTGTVPLQAVNDAIHAYPGTLFVVAAGNRGVDVDASPDYPCVIPEPNLLCVAATTAADALASYSNWGATSVDVAAPGDQITSTCLGSPAYCVKSGTSMAAPHVAGVAALLAARVPSATAAQLKQAILSSARPLPALAGEVASGGLVNAAAALRDTDGDGTIDVFDSTPTGPPPPPSGGDPPPSTDPAPAPAPAPSPAPGKAGKPAKQPKPPR
jgi:subtilisin family serine protease